MNARQAVIVVALILASATIVALPAVGATATPTATNASDGDAGLGTQMTAFMQSSAARANDSVDNGMWVARSDRANASERADLVRSRTGALDRRLERLRERNRTLEAQYENGSIPEPAYVARSSRLAGEIAALQESLDDTERVANRSGVNATGLDRLRQNASDLRGPQVAAIARGLVGGQPGPPDGVPGGPQGVPGNEPPDDVPANRSDGADAPGPPGNAGENADPKGGNGTNDANQPGPPGAGDQTGPPGEEAQPGPPGGGNESSDFRNEGGSDATDAADDPDAPDTPDPTDAADPADTPDTDGATDTPDSGDGDDSVNCPGGESGPPDDAPGNVPSSC